MARIGNGSYFGPRWMEIFKLCDWRLGGNGAMAGVFIPAQEINGQSSSLSIGGGMPSQSIVSRSFIMKPEGDDFVDGVPLPACEERQHQHSTETLRRMIIDTAENPEQAAMVRRMFFERLLSEPHDTADMLHSEFDEIGEIALNPRYSRAVRMAACDILDLKDARTTSMQDVVEGMDAMDGDEWMALLFDGAMSDELAEVADIHKYMVACKFFGISGPLASYWDFRHCVETHPVEVRSMAQMALSVIRDHEHTSLDNVMAGWMLDKVWHSDADDHVSPAAYRWAKALRETAVQMILGDAPADVQNPKLIAMARAYQRLSRWFGYYAWYDWRADWIADISREIRTLMAMRRSSNNLEVLFATNAVRADFIMQLLHFAQRSPGEEGARVHEEVDRIISDLSVPAEGVSWVTAAFRKEVRYHDRLHDSFDVYYPRLLEKMTDEDLCHERTGLLFMLPAEDDLEINDGEDLPSPRTMASLQGALKRVSQLIESRKPGPDDN